MKNLHLIPTDKPSRLVKHNITNVVELLSGYIQTNLAYTTQNIYITNSEQIRLNDYITDGYSVWKWKDDSSLLGRKKVILTTDSTLIADNVQVIDDEFLEWFVKNPSCEFVKVNKEWNEERIINGKDIGDYSYKIIIPKEDKVEITKPKYTNQKLWDMAKVITKKQKAATEIDLSKVDWNMLEETWFDWLYQELIENN
jgi:hypothetical protein